MGILDSIGVRVPVGFCCSSGFQEDKKSNVAVTPQLQGNMSPSVGGARMNVGLASPSPVRFPSTQFPTRPISPAPLSTPQSPGPAVKALLSTADQTVVHQQRRELIFATGVKVIPHPDKVAKGGEDAYLTCNYKGGVLGVADGVSGWAAENVDPALFSKEFMAHATAFVGGDDVKDDPRLLLAKAHSATCSVGAATAIVAILDERGILHVANLGDCGLRLVRNGKVVFATAPQQHYFDCPYQFSSENAQTADDAAVYELDALEGDTVVMGSDGLFDNVYDTDIETTVKVLSGSDKDSANRLGIRRALVHQTPWSEVDRGKLDDITVVVGHVVSVPISEPSETKVSEELLQISQKDQSEMKTTEEQPDKLQSDDCTEVVQAESVGDGDSTNHVKGESENEKLTTATLKPDGAALLERESPASSTEDEGPPLVGIVLDKSGMVQEELDVSSPHEGKESTDHNKDREPASNVNNLKEESVQK